MRRHHDQATRRQIAEQARRCVEWLKISGFDVLVVLGGSFQPRVVIKPSQLCSMLDGVVNAYERTPRGERRYSYVSRFDCMVEWEVA